MKYCGIEKGSDSMLGLIPVLLDTLSTESISYLHDTGCIPANVYIASLVVSVILSKIHSR